MDRQANVNKTLPAKGDVINDLFAQHYRASLRTAFRILRSNEDADDAVQNAYFEAFRHFNKFRGESSFKTWITRIVVNCYLMHLRERHYRPQVPLDDVPPAGIVDAIVCLTSPSSDWRNPARGRRCTQQQVVIRSEKKLAADRCLALKTGPARTSPP